MDATRLCKKCDQVKPLTEYGKLKTWYRHTCNACKLEYEWNYGLTLRGCLSQVWNRAKSNAKQRVQMGREQAGEFTLTFGEVLELWHQQQRKCYWSGVPMRYDLHEWRPSLERLDTQCGYVHGNVVICCLEFNGKCQWTHEKLHEMLQILREPACPLFSFALKSGPRQERTSCPERTVDGQVFKLCKVCEQWILLDSWSKSNNMCKPCDAKQVAERQHTPRGKMQHLVNHAKGRKDRSYHEAVTAEYLQQLYYTQGGLCAYSGLPLQFGSYKDKHWTVSLEHIDVMKGYEQDNVCLISYEFNTTDMTVRMRDKDTGNGGWTRDKFLFMLHHAQQRSIFSQQAMETE